MTYHVPVLLNESLEALQIQPGGVYVDVTVGGGGHSRAILNRMDSQARLLGFDQDPDVLAELPIDERFTFVQANFRDLRPWLKLNRAMPADGILADLGVSSWQLDAAERGFAYRLEAPLDMRMDRTGKETAARVLNTNAADYLQQMFSAYGEVRNSKTLAEAIVQQRSKQPFQWISDLVRLLETLWMGDKHRYFAQVFQAIRIEVNDEMGALQEFLRQSLEVLKPGGRLVVISYHSLEDRLVKNFMKAGNFEGDPIQDDFGHISRPWKLITKKPLLPGHEEVLDNSRSRSAKLRVAEKI
ncbi:MAG: 16S rRNA (cytosine(1402)-N(4))-methyltransferase RsmH [Saprospiraceae bacterium]